MLLGLALVGADERLKRWVRMHGRVVSREEAIGLKPDEERAVELYDRIGKYHIIRYVDRGGFATVYEGWDQGTRRSVAIKVLRNDGNLARFQREATITAGLSAEVPAVAQIYEIEEDKALKFHYLVEEFLSGVDLRHKLAERDRLPLWLRLHYLQQVAAAMAEIHQRDVIHRDLKPDNIRILHGHNIKLMDFGIAKSMDSTDAGLTMTGGLLGTWDDLAPEQAKETRKAGKPADIFSFGVTAYEVLTGKHHLGGGLTWDDCFTKLQEGRSTPIQRHWPTCPAEIADIVHRCLKVDPALRPTAAELRDRLLILRDSLKDCAMPDWPGVSADVETRKPEQLRRSEITLGDLESFEPDGGRRDEVEILDGSTIDLRNGRKKSLWQATEGLLKTHWKFFAAAILLVVVALGGFRALTRQGSVALQSEPDQQPKTVEESDRTLEAFQGVGNPPMVTLEWNLEDIDGEGKLFYLIRDPGWKVGHKVFPEIAAELSELDSGKWKYVDSRDIRRGITYTYRLKARDLDGSVLAQSEAITIEILESSPDE